MQRILKSTNTFFGDPDLDLRPPELLRSTINTWVQRCPHCGYCYYNIEKGDTKYKKILSSPEYIDQLNSNQYTELANSFQCLALIKMIEDKAVEVGSEYHNAAWVCDDKGYSGQAVMCRTKAIHWYEIAVSRGEPFFYEQELVNLMMADLYRRVGSFEKALVYCEKGMSQTDHDEYRAFYRQENALIQAKDTDRHSTN
jgi:hypothetical protein